MILPEEIDWLDLELIVLSQVKSIATLSWSIPNDSSGFGFGAYMVYIGLAALEVTEEEGLVIARDLLMATAMETFASDGDLKCLLSN